MENEKWLGPAVSMTLGFLHFKKLGEEGKASFLLSGKD